MKTRNRLLERILYKLSIIILVFIITFSYFPLNTINAESETDEEKDELMQSLVPLLADSIISKYANTNISGTSDSSSGSGGIINSYEETGDGWLSVTEVKYPNGVTRKFRNYQQGIASFCSYWDKPYWGGTMQDSGCGPAAAAIVLSGYGYDAGPYDVVNAMKEKNSGSFGNLRQAMKDIGNIEAEDHLGNGQSSDIQIIRDNFNKGRPVIVNAPNHYIVLLGEDSNGKLIVSDPGTKFYVSKGYENIGPSVPGAPDNLEDFVNNGMITCGYILITSDGNASTSTSSSSSSGKSKSSSTSSKKSSSGKASTQKCNISSGGYEAIFTSGTTGRQFKEFKQNSPDYSYPGLSGTYWGQECTTVSLGIVGSGYNKDLDIQEIANKLNNNGGNTNFTGFLSDWTGQNIQQYDIPSKEDLIDKLSKGYVGTVYDFKYSSRGHMVAMLDISKDKKEVYISNPDVYQPGADGIGTGWTSIDKFYDSISSAGGDAGVPGKSYTYFATNDGSIIDYSGSGSSVKNIAEDKIFYIGDSWIELLKSSGKAKSPGSYFYGKSGKNADWVLETYSSMKIPSDASCIVVKFGLNGTNLWNKTQELVDKLATDHPDKEIFVLQTPHVCEDYSLYGMTSSKFNAKVDEYNKNMKSYCNRKKGVTYIDPTINIVADKGKGYLKKEYAEGTFHLNSSGNKVWYDDIIKCIKATIQTDSETVNMTDYIVERDGKYKGKGYKLNIDLDKEVEYMLKKLEEKDFKLKDYLSESNQKEYLKNILRACIVIQYPDLRTADEIAKNSPTDDMQGCVKVKRYSDSDTEAFAPNLSNINDKDDEKGRYLSYMPYKDFTQLVDNTDKSALNYFSLDSSNNIVVAGWETLDVSISISQIAGDSDPNPDSAPEARAKAYSKLTMNKIDYLNQISNYTMPFSLFWSLLVYGGDEDFINQLAVLGINTRIEIGSYDATTTKVTTYTKTYDKHMTTTDTIYMDHNSIGESVVVDHVYTYQITETHTLKTDKPSIKVKYADTWTAVYSKDYELLYKDSTSEDEAEFKDEIVDAHYGQAIKDGDIQDRIKDNPKAQEQIKKEKERLKAEAHKYNQENFKYRYEYLNEEIDRVYGSEGEYIKLLKEEDVQNYVINMIIDQNSKDYISKFFGENEIILEYAEEKGANTEDAASIVKRMVEEAKEEKNSGRSLWNKLTKDHEDTRKNKTYSVDVSGIQYEDAQYRRKQGEKTDIETKSAEIQEVTNKKGKENVRIKIDPHAKENSFVKQLFISRHARHNLKMISEWFFDSLEETASIADLEDLLKYLFQVVFKKNYGIKEEDINKLKDYFDPEKMQSFNKKQTAGGTVVGGASYSSIKLTEEELQMLYKLVQAENSMNPTWTACTVLNRILSSSFPNSMEEVIFASGQFQVTWDGAYDAANPTQETIDAINEVLKTGDVSNGSIGFQTIELYDSQYPGQTWETPIETLREDYGGRGSSVYFTTASIQAELSQFK